MADVVEVPCASGRLHAGGGRFPGLSGAAAWFRVIPRRALVRVLLMGFR